VLWSKAVVHRDYEATNLVDQSAARSIEAVEAAGDKAAPMKIYEYGEGSIAKRSIDPYCNVASRLW
jgi:hypothetical protein